MMGLDQEDEKIDGKSENGSKKGRGSKAVKVNA